MGKFLSLGLIAAVVVGFAALVWAFEYRQRATQAEVTRAVYQEFGRRGPQIVCTAADGRGSRWNCSSVRWGDNPNCRQVFVSWTGAMHVSHRTVACEG